MTADIVALSPSANAGLPRWQTFPQGICLFTPDETQEHYLTDLSPGMPPQVSPKVSCRLPGLLMGSTSSVGQSCSSDLDLGLPSVLALQ
ncbi:hypothetical protein ACNKHS_22800 [Shigella flexneri]